MGKNKIKIHSKSDPFLQRQGERRKDIWRHFKGQRRFPIFILCKIQEISDLYRKMFYINPYFH